MSARIAAMLRRARTVATGYAMHVFLPGIDRAAAFFACPRGQEHLMNRIYCVYSAWNSADR